MNTQNTHPSRALRATLCALALVGTTLGLRAQMGSSDTSSPTPPDSSGAPTSPPSSSNLARGDRHFIMTAAQSSANEVALSQVAADHASNPDVKAFAAQMITAHTQLNSEIQSLASQKGVDITKAVEKGNEKGVKSLSEKSGTDFDQAYVKAMVSGHEDAAKLFEKESTNGKDPDAMALANKYVSTINQHLEHAKGLQKAVN
jgi:putative membrane protein